jgi:membrane peptidoglycan carboxypeptidase
MRELTINIPGSGPWSPRNYDGKYYGFVTLTEALARSLNTPAVRVSEAMGRARVREVANQFGLRSELAEGPALALGASESTLIDMTSAYAGILNGGIAVRPYGIQSLSLLGEAAPLFSQADGLGDRVIGERSAQMLTWMMTQVLEGGTGGRARLDGRQAAGKTGTTQAARDAWFVGFTADYVAGVWMGYDDNSPLTGVTGGGLPAEIWREVMMRVHEGLPARPLPMRAATILCAAAGRRGAAWWRDPAGGCDSRRAGGDFRRELTGVNERPAPDGGFRHDGQFCGGVGRSELIALRGTKAEGRRASPGRPQTEKPATARARA